MKKLYFKGKEVHIGDMVYKSTVFKDPSFGRCYVSEGILVSHSTIPDLIKNGTLVLKEVNVDKNMNNLKDKINDINKSIKNPVNGIKDAKAVKVPVELDYYIRKLADSLGWKPEKMCNYLNSIDNIYPAAAYAIILKEIAIELDKKYKDHIKDSKEIYVISLLDGKIAKVDKNSIKNYKNFAAFRTKEDAEIAYTITEPLLKSMF